MFTEQRKGDGTRGRWWIRNKIGTEEKNNVNSEWGLVADVLESLGGERRSKDIYILQSAP